MLASHMEDLHAKIRTIEDSLRTNEAIRELLSTHEFRPLLLPVLAQDAALRVKYHALTPTTWRALDHATALTSLYGAYERFVYDLLREWLSQVPSIHSQYSALQNRMKTAHRLGLATILQKIDHRRYKGLSLGGILRDFAAASDGVHPYRLLPEAFFSEDDNLRKEPLEALFARAGIQHTWQWIMHHPAVVDFLTNVRGGQNTAESELAEFIDYRNDAAHGNVDNVLGLNALLDICAFIGTLSEAITQLVRHQLLAGYVQTGRAIELGRITEIFRHGDIGIGKTNLCTIRVCDQVLLQAQDRCLIATVESLQENDIDRQEITATANQELGIRFTTRVVKDMAIVRVRDDEFILDYSI
jgi:hypothetical protein